MKKLRVVPLIKRYIELWFGYGFAVSFIFLGSAMTTAFLSALMRKGGWILSILGLAIYILLDKLTIKLVEIFYKAQSDKLGRKFISSCINFFIIGVVIIACKRIFAGFEIVENDFGIYKYLLPITVIGSLLLIIPLIISQKFK